MAVALPRAGKLARICKRENGIRGRNGSVVVGSVLALGKGRCFDSTATAMYDVGVLFQVLVQMVEIMGGPIPGDEKARGISLLGEKVVYKPFIKF